MKFAWRPNAYIRSRSPRRRNSRIALVSITDGLFKPDFSGGFGASVTMSTRPKAGGKAVRFPLKLWRDNKKDDMLLTAGYDSEGDVLIENDFGYTIPTAWENVMRKAAQVKFPYRSYRTDGDRTDFPASPIRLYEALRAMGYI